MRWQSSRLHHDTKVWVARPVRLLRPLEDIKRHPSGNLKDQIMVVVMRLEKLDRT